MGSPLSETDFGRYLGSFASSAFRLELQPAYSEPTEDDTVAKFVAGHPEPPTAVPSLASWFDQVTALTGSGKTVQRVRVQEDPPTPYQNWERWISRWNASAGEKISYLTRARARQIGLLPAAGTVDWWLLDDERLIVMHFDSVGHRILSELVDDADTVAQARVWRDLALHHSVPLEESVPTE